jgi:hypothetical protein
LPSVSDSCYRPPRRSERSAVLPRRSWPTEYLMTRSEPVSTPQDIGASTLGHRRISPIVGGNSKDQNCAELYFWAVQTGCLSVPTEWQKPADQKLPPHSCFLTERTREKPRGPLYFLSSLLSGSDSGSAPTERESERDPSPFRSRRTQFQTGCRCRTSMKEAQRSPRPQSLRGDISSDRRCGRATTKRCGLYERALSCINIMAQHAEHDHTR